MSEGVRLTCAKIDDVQVPEGIQPGGEFEVTLAGRKSRSTGQPTTSKKKLWRASGMWPTIATATRGGWSAVQSSSFLTAQVG